MKLERVAHACFRLTLSNGKVVYFDPYKIPKGAPQADYIFASHEHYDHFDDPSIKTVLKKSTVLVVPKTCAKAIAAYNAKGISPGDKLKFEDLELEAIPAYNLNKKFHPKANQWVGYILTAEGKKILHSGDTDCIPEYSKYQGVDVAMLPVGGTYTMDFDEGIQAASKLKPKILIPMHEWDNDLEQFKAKIKNQLPDIRVEIVGSSSLTL